MRRMQPLVFSFLFLLMKAAPLLAQTQTGSILVKIIDEQHAVVPGVSLTISSPTLIAGTMAGTSDAGGAYRFPSLTPGVYSLKIELSGFQTLVRENISVNAGQTVPLDFTLAVA